MKEFSEGPVRVGERSRGCYVHCQSDGWYAVVLFEMQMEVGAAGLGLGQVWWVMWEELGPRVWMY